MHGICHLEIPSRDFAKAKKFYGDLFNWQFEEIKDWNYLIFRTPDGVNGGFDQSLEIASKPGHVFYIEVEDVAETLKKAGELGGETIKDKTQISPEFGYMAFVKDLDGNQMGLWSKK